MKLTEMQMLKYWIDSEFTVLHIMFAVIMWQLTDGWLPHLLLAIYIIYCGVYILVRLAYIVSQDKDYLKVPKK